MNPTGPYHLQKAQTQFWGQTASSLHVHLEILEIKYHKQNVPCICAFQGFFVVVVVVET